MAANAGTMVGQVPKIVEDFSVGLHKNLANKIEGNFVSSALSVHIVLAMANYGASDTTAQEMRSVLRLPQNDEENYQGFHDLIHTLNNVPNVTLNLANKIYASNDIKIKDSFQKITSTHFSSATERVNFTNAESIGAINKWCSDATNGKIQNMLSENDVDPSTSMVLLNAVYFKGNWKYQFSKSSTHSAPFHVNERTTVEVPMMRIEEEIFYKDLQEMDAECIGLPYKNEEVLMLIIVPKKVDGLKNVEQNLEKFSFNYEKDFLKSHHPKIGLSMPKFKIEAKINMVPYLQELGMISAFTDEANFSGISDDGLKISAVKHRAIIEVDEQGSEAAAVTGLIMMKMSMPLPPPIQVNINKPFLYKIVYKSNTLFSGRVANPLNVN